jgi:hypothetical protein
MARSQAATVAEYLTELPPDRATAISTVRQVINKHLPVGYEEAMAWGMIAWQVPLATYPDTYNKQPLMLAALASQKNYLSLYLNTVYAIPEFKALLDNSGKKLKMGKGCINFISANELPLDAIGEIISRSSLDMYLAMYERMRAERKAGQ